MKKEPLGSSPGRNGTKWKGSPRVKPGAQRDDMEMVTFQSATSLRFKAGGRDMWSTGRHVPYAVDPRIVRSRQSQTEEPTGVKTAHGKAKSAFRNIVRLLLVSALCATTSACVARTAVKATSKVAKTTVKAAGAVACTTVDIAVKDPKCKE